MTYEEAIKVLTDTRVMILKGSGTDLSKACSMAIEALEKQIPKKVEYGIDGSWGTEKEQPVCPVCDYFITQTYFIGEGKKVTYCDHCGQAIDWSEQYDLRRSIRTDMRRLHRRKEVPR